MNPNPLPNFIHFGTPKSGSGTISRLLVRHPQVFCPRPKELNFFNVDRDFNRGLGWYSSTYFSGHAGQPIICDKSIGYSVADPKLVLDRIVNSLGRDIRILITARNPASRAYSHYCMARYKAQVEDLSFMHALRSALDLSDYNGREALSVIGNGDYYNSRREMAIFRYANYLVPGHYSQIIRMCHEAVGVGNCLVIFSEDMATDLVGAVRELTDFLAIDAIGVDPGLRANEATSLRFPIVRRTYNRLFALSPVRRLVNRMSPETRRFMRKRFLSWNYTRNVGAPPPDPDAVGLLQDYYADDIRDLQALTGRDLSHWLEHRTPEETKR